MPFDPKPYDLGLSIGLWVAVFGGSVALVVLVLSIIMLVKSGKAGVWRIADHIRDGVHEFLQISARRVMALATLTFRESVRRKTLLVFVVFAVLFMFAG